MDAEIPDKADEDSAQDAPESCTNNPTTGLLRRDSRRREIGGVGGEFFHCDNIVVVVYIGGISEVVVVDVGELKRCGE